MREVLTEPKQGAGLSLSAGKPSPLGATIEAGGVNFALYSEHATSVVLCLFDEAADGTEREIHLTGKTGHVWHGFVEGAAAGQVYGYRVDGPWAPA